MLIPEIEEVKKCAEEYPVVPVCRSLYSDIKTPVEVLRILKRVSRNCYMLESLEDATKWGRYTFLGYDPKMEITCVNGTTFINGKVIEGKKHPKEHIKNVLKEYESPKITGLPPFTGGLVGYFSYDYIKYEEPTLKLDAKNEDGFKDIDLMLFDKVIAFDNLKQKIILIVNIKTDAAEENYKQAEREIDEISSLIASGKPAENKPIKLKSDFKEMFDSSQYCKMVEEAQKRITEGDIFQVVLSNRLEAEVSGSLLDTYRVLRAINPSPYMFYFSSDDIEMAGASPETLVKLKDRIVYTYPLAGTRPRGANGSEDIILERELLEDPKELSEHNMLVDLGRNDLGKICKFGSVEVDKYMCIEKFSHVMHIASSVRGKLRDDKDAVDAISAVLPAGTLSGAPKIKACEIINQLENNKRGIYGGAIGYIDFSGNMDTCIAIRIAFKKNGKVFIRSGAGIVADSVPEKEYQECKNKAKAVINAIRAANGGIDYDSIDR